jgi:hypothetical protein
MKTFEIITEADARVLERGETVMLVRAGHVTPLAQDTLQERRVTVIRDGHASADEAALAPKADVRSVAIASDEGGVNCGKRSSRFCAAVDSRSRTLVPTAPIRSIIRTSPPPSRGSSHARRPTQGS